MILTAMKNTYLTLTLTFTFCFTGCSNFLNETPNRSGSALIYHMDQLYNLMGDFQLYRNGYPWNDLIYLGDAVEYPPYFVKETNRSGLDYSVYSWDVETLEKNTSAVNCTWIPAYNHLFKFNTVLENMDNVIQSTPAIRKEVEGEALFGRAFYHFLLLVQYALWDEEAPGIGYRTNTLPNDIPQRETVKYTLDMIYQDLDNAEASLIEAGRTVFEIKRNFRPTVPTVKALKARIDLYRGNYASALENANAALAAYDVLQDFKNDDLYRVFEQDVINVLDQNNQVVVGTIPYRITTNLQTRAIQAVSEYVEFYLPQTTEVYYANKNWYTISEAYYNLFDHENDERWKRFYNNNAVIYHLIAKTMTLPGNTTATPRCFTWENQQAMKEANRHVYMRFINFAASPGKYYILGLTTAEMYLIKAECLSRAGNTAEAANVLRALRRTRFTTTAAADNIGGSLHEVLDERAREMSEIWRFFDIKRLNGADKANIKIMRTILTNPTDINSTQMLEVGPNDTRWAVPIDYQQMILMNWKQN